MYEKVALKERDCADEGDDLIPIVESQIHPKLEKRMFLCALASVLFIVSTFAFCTMIILSHISHATSSSLWMEHKTISNTDEHGRGADLHQQQVLHDGALLEHSVIAVTSEIVRKSCYPPNQDVIDAWLNKKIKHKEILKFYVQTFWEPCVSCFHEVRIGKEGDGGKWICSPHMLFPTKLSSEECHLLSVGSHNQFDFERELVLISGCTITVFDGTSNPPKFVDGIVSRNSPAHFVPSSMENKIDFQKKMFNATEFIEYAEKKDSISVFKIDCEGCEYALFSNPVVQSILRAKVTVLLLEVHYKRDSGTWPAMWRNLSATGFVLYHKEVNVICGPTCVEVALVNSKVVANKIPNLPHFP